MHDFGESQHQADKPGYLRGKNTSFKPKNEDWLTGDLRFETNKG